MGQHIVDKAGMVIDPKQDGGQLVTLLAAREVKTNEEVTGAWITGLDRYQMAVLSLAVSGKNMDAGTTLDVYVQTSPDGGATVDDLAHFTQITSAAMPNGVYVVFLNPHQVAPLKDRAAAAKALAANTIQSLHWCDRLRVVLVPTNFAGADSVTVRVSGYFVRT